MPWSIYSWGKSAYSASLQVKSGVSVSGFLPHHSCTSHSFIFFPITSFLQDELHSRNAKQILMFFLPDPYQHMGQNGISPLQARHPFQSWWGAVRGCLSTLNSDLRARPFAPEGLILPSRDCTGSHNLEQGWDLLGLGANELLLGAHLSWHVRRSRSHGLRWGCFSLASK